MSSSRTRSSSPGPGWIAAVGPKMAGINGAAPGRMASLIVSTRACAMSCSTAIFYSLKQARIVIESWRCHCNTERRQRSLGYKLPSPNPFVPAFAVATTQFPQLLRPRWFRGRPCTKI